MKNALVVAVLLTSIGSVAAADMPVKAPVNNFLAGYPYSGSGFYFGLYTEGGGGSVNGSVPGVGSASLTLNSASVGGSVGHVWASPKVPAFVAVEAMFGWTNFNGNSQGFSLSGPASFEQRFLLGTPLANFLSLLPNLPNIGTVAPFPSLPGGATVTNAHPYIMAAIHEDDISLNFPGLAANREWRVAPAIGIGMMGQLTDVVAIDAWVETVFPDKASCVGPVGGTACGGLGQQVKVGLALKY